MNPEVIRKLQIEVPELQELIVFLSAEAEKLNTLANIELTDPTEIAIEVLARKRAYDTVRDMISPLLDTQPQTTGANNAEFVV